MYPNLFKHLDSSKNFKNIPENKGIPTNDNESDDKDNLFGKDQIQKKEECYPEVSVQTFFDFMRTAYQVNESFEELASTLTANSAINWTELTRISLNLDSLEKKVEKEKDVKKDSELKYVDSQESNPVLLPSEVDCYQVQEDCSIALKVSKELSTCDHNSRKNSLAEKSFSKTKSLSSIKLSRDIQEPPLSFVMKRCLSDVLHEGLLDSVLPYMIPKLVLSQPVLRKSIVLEPKKSMSNQNECNRNSTDMNDKEKDKENNKHRKSTESEVEIHVCDEAKNIKKDFCCPQKLLVQKMCYFADVTAGQKLEDMDISVHCDVTIFDWLMRWVKKDLLKKSEWPVLEPNNVVPIMVSASFLQMEPLLEDCLAYCHDNMSEILKSTSVLTCLNDTLLSRLADLFTNAEVETLKDKKDKIQSRLFCRLIMSLANTRPDSAKGHFSSLATLLKCLRCGKNVLRSVSDLVPCIPCNMRIDSRGNIYSKHVRDMTWNLNDYIQKLRSELCSWRKVYWRLWGDCHFLLCRQCGIYFPINQMSWCSYHPESPQFFINEQQKTTPFPLGRFPCCSQRAYRFQALINRDGCRFREHVPDIVSERDEFVVNVFLAHREIISVEAPQLFFPEKITRLKVRDPSLPPGQLACKETFWWEGIEIMPPRPKLGLLAKIWGGSSLPKRSKFTSQKMKKKERHQISQLTESSSTVSSESCDDEDNGSSSDSSTADESLASDQTRDVKLPDYSRKRIKRVNNHKRSQMDGIGSWSSDLSVRYNQDNQRDAEEKIAAQMVSLLSKRNMLEHNLRSKSLSLGKHTIWNNHAQPIGGSYVKLEAEFFCQLAQNSRCKSAANSKGIVRVKSSK
ncbi:hypothetical protein QAD02_019186 [Eretmocerus hayati]|uniref:Uncharacterized protein n=1 Tax=Eretmocerus hayati TaxID=131215 RepID=A0ACC2PIG5_9HYME|nr:hypothetical protein QAD02_019186 [Eretmocerus hayati]